MESTQNVALLGVGTMGSAFARRLLGAGMRVTVWDVSPAATARLADAGAGVAATPEEAVRDAAVVLTMVPTITSIEETMPRALAAMPRGATWLQMSTIGVDGTERAIALAKEHRPDIVFVDAPVSGSRAPAELNAWLAVLGEGIAEAAALAQSLYVSLNDVSACLESTALNAPWALSKLDKIERSAFDPDFSLALASKDLHLALDAASRAKRRLPMAQSIATQWEGALAAGFGDRDVIGAFLALTASTP